MTIDYLEGKVSAFESIHNMDSGTFRERYRTEDMDEPVFNEWAGVLRMLDRLRARERGQLAIEVP